MLLVMKIVYVVFAAVMVFFAKKIWDMVYGKFSENAEPKDAMLMAYRAAGIIALVVFIMKGIWGS